MTLLNANLIEHWLGTDRQTDRQTDKATANIAHLVHHVHKQ